VLSCCISGNICPRAAEKCSCFTTGNIVLASEAFSGTCNQKKQLRYSTSKQTLIGSLKLHLMSQTDLVVLTAFVTVTSGNMTSRATTGSICGQ